MSDRKKLFIKTYGCQMNVYDSERMAASLDRAGYDQTDSADEADMVLLNTCHIREKASEKVYSELGRIKELKASKPDMKIGVAGCVAQAEGEEIVRRQPAFDHLPDERKARRAPAAFLTVQEGCDKFCAFCVVPYTRGAEVSRPAERILGEARDLVARGVAEITLLGQNVNAYHGGMGLAGLIRELAKIEGLERIRFTTSHPNDMDSYFKLIDRIREARPDIAMSGDFIVGFPGETEEDFQATLDLVEQVTYAQAFSFKYSARPGTPAADREEVPEDVKTERLARLQAVLTRQQREFQESMIDRKHSRCEDCVFRDQFSVWRDGSLNLPF